MLECDPDACGDKDAEPTEVEAPGGTYDGRAHTGIDGTGGTCPSSFPMGDGGPDTVRLREGAAAALSFDPDADEDGDKDFGSPGSVESLFSPKDIRRGDVRAGEGGEGGTSCRAGGSTGAGSSSFRLGGGMGAPRSVPVGDAGALAEVLPSSFMRADAMSGVELILLGLNFFALSVSLASSGPVSVPSCESASDGPARGDERSGRDSRRGAATGAGAR